MEIPQILALYDREQRRDILYPDMTRQARLHVVRYTRPAPGVNLIKKLGFIQIATAWACEVKL